MKAYISRRNIIICFVFCISACNYNHKDETGSENTISKYSESSNDSNKIVKSDTLTFYDSAQGVIIGLQYVYSDAKHKNGRELLILGSCLNGRYKALDQGFIESDDIDAQTKYKFGSS